MSLPSVMNATILCLLRVDEFKLRDSFYLTYCCSSSGYLRVVQCSSVVAGRGVVSEAIKMCVEIFG